MGGKDSKLTPEEAKRLHKDIKNLLQLIESGIESEVIRFIKAKDITQSRCRELCRCHRLEPTEGPVQVAAQLGYVRIMDALVRRGFSPHDRWYGSITLEHPIHAACRHGHLNVVKSLVEKHGVNVDQCEGTMSGWSPLIATLTHPEWGQSQVEIVKYLLQSGASVNNSMLDMSPLRISISAWKPEVCLYLVQHGADVNEHHFYNGDTPLHFAAGLGKVNHLQVMADADPHIDAVNCNHETPLLVAASSDHIDVMRLLISKGANPEHGNYQGDTPLHCAVRLNAFKIVKYLIFDIGVSTATYNDSGKSPFSLAVEASNERVINLFLITGYTPGIEELAYDSFSITEKTRRIIEVIKQVASSPQTLQILCTLKLRQMLPGKLSETHFLPLPQRLKDTISLDLYT